MSEVIRILRALPRAELMIDGAEKTLWESWEWRCVWTSKRELRLFHNDDLYVETVVENESRAVEISRLWLAALEAIRLRQRQARSENR